MVKLETKIRARNSVHALALEQTPRMIAALQPFLGKKILNAGNVLSDKVRAALPKDNPQGPVREDWYYPRSEYSLWVTFRIADGSDGSTCYQECTVCLGEIEDKILVNLRPVDMSLRTDYTPAEIIHAREKLEAAERQVRDWESAVQFFGRYDS